VNPTLKAALKYIDLGWSIIPIRPRTKAPMVEWSEYQSRRMGKKEAHTWWDVPQPPGIAVVTGKISDTVVVDIDPEGANPEQFLRNNRTGVWSKTGGGGHHFFYKYPEGVDHVYNRVNLQGVDIRGDGGYVVVPPTRHANGRLYEWGASPNGRAILSKAPAIVLDAPQPPDQIQHQKETDKWLSRVMQGVSSGERNDIAARLTGYYVRKGMPIDVVLQMMQDWNTKNDPPLPVREIATVVESVFKTALRRRPITEGDNKDPFGLIDLATFMTSYGAAGVSWVINDWLPDSTIGMVVAPPGSYKSWMDLDLAVSVATGLPFLGSFPVERPGPVIIVQQEDYHGITAERLAVIINSKIEMPVYWEMDDQTMFEFMPPPIMPIYLHTDRRLQFKDNVVMEALELKIAQIKPVLVIIDPLYSTGDVDKFMMETLQQMFTLKDLRDRYGCSFLLIHHTRKSADTTRREDAWGVQFLNAFLETGWQIRPKEGTENQITVRRHFKNSKNQAEASLKFDINTEIPYSYNVIYSATNEKMPVTEIGIIDVMVSARKPLRHAEIMKLTGIAKSTLTRRLEALMKAGQIVLIDGDKYDLAPPEPA
jgi:hypothetical protein